ncbi:hypothetical protein B0H63DRAFT_444081 [Podospora didyma]|uniref:Uncharacterized protein n=1 Tax=Podospora didyma TaxID=330526 RepID=A0AAE0U815_9PEZI|nr:hypothetical protein B0H63DRAFT_444081 [Podospora didyma]
MPSDDHTSRNKRKPSDSDAELGSISRRHIEPPPPPVRAVNASAVHFSGLESGLDAALRGIPELESRAAYFHFRKNGADVRRSNNLENLVEAVKQAYQGGGPGSYVVVVKKVAEPQPVADDDLPGLRDYGIALPCNHKHRIEDADMPLHSPVGPINSNDVPRQTIERSTVSLVQAPPPRRLDSTRGANFIKREETDQIPPATPTYPLSPSSLSNHEPILPQLPNCHLAGHRLSDCIHASLDGEVWSAPPTVGPFSSPVYRFPHTRAFAKDLRMSQPMRYRMHDYTKELVNLPTDPATSSLVAVMQGDWSDQLWWSPGAEERAAETAAFGSDGVVQMEEH